MDGGGQTAVNKLLKSLLENSLQQVLGFSDPKLLYVLHRDASTTGLGAELYQEQEGKMRVIAFASRGLSKSKSHKLEFLALKWAVI